MTTNVLNLAKFSSASTFAIAKNSDWLDSIFFAAPGSPAASVSASAVLIAGTNVITIASTAGLIGGQPIGEIPGIPPSTYIGAVFSPTQLTMVDAIGAPVNATLSDAAAGVTFLPLPLDLTGITFKANLRTTVDDVGVQLALSTDAGTLINGGKSGVLSFNVLATSPALVGLNPQNYVIDILAEADGHTINLFPQGPATLTVSRGVTVP
jgi:hypothetical protein